MEFMKLNIQLFATTLFTGSGTSASVGGSGHSSVSGAYIFRCKVELNSQDTVNNTSNITITHTGDGEKNFHYSQFGSPKSYIYVYDSNGAQIGYKEAVVGAINLSETTMNVYTLDIPHANNGELTFSVKCTYKANTTSYYYMPKDNTINSGPITNTPQILRAPEVAVNSYIPYTNSFEIGVYTTNTIPLTHVQASYTINGTNYSYLFAVTNGKINISGFNAKTNYTINLKGYNDTYGTLESTGINVTYRTAPNEITSNSTVIDLNNPDYNTDALDTWNVGVLANLTYGNGNSINDLYQIVYTFKDPNDNVVGTVTKTLSNYTTYARVSGLLPETTYTVDIDIYTDASYGSTTRRWVYSTYTEFTTLEKFKKIWIKNPQGQWIRGVLYIKTPTGWKPAKRIYIKTDDSTWSESYND